MKKPVLYLLVLIAILLLVKHFFFPVPTEDSGMKGPGPGPMPAAVTGYIAKAEPLDNSIQVTGSLMANESVELRSEISGRVVDVRFEEGQEVSQGALLVKLQDQDLLAQLKKVKAKASLAKDHLKRLTELFNIQGVSREELDNAENEVNALEADAEVLRVQVDRTEIRAPFSGTIGLRSISKGSYVSPQQLIARIQQMQPMKVEFSVPERIASQIVKGAGIQFVLDGDSTRHSGKIYALEPSVDAGTRSLLVRALAPNADRKLIPGRFAKVDIKLAEIPNAVMIPTQSVVPVLKGQQVYVSRAGKAEAIPVKLGLRNDLQVQVVEGIQAGDTVITTGLMGLKPGADLKFINFK